MPDTDTFKNLFDIKEKRINEIMNYIQDYFNSHKTESDAEVIVHFIDKFKDPKELTFIMYVLGAESNIVITVNFLESILCAMGLSYDDIDKILFNYLLKSSYHLMDTIGKSDREPNGARVVYMTDTKEGGKGGYTS